MAFTGVRTSCEIMAANSSFCSEAATSAFSLAVMISCGGGERHGSKYSDLIRFAMISCGGGEWKHTEKKESVYTDVTWQAGKHPRSAPLTKQERRTASSQPGLLRVAAAVPLRSASCGLIRELVANSKPF